MPSRANSVTVDSIRELSGLSSTAITPGQRLTLKNEDKDMVVLPGGEPAGRPLVKLIFDDGDRLLVRQIRYIARRPHSHKLHNYTAVNSIRIPLTWELTWTDGRKTYRLDPRQIQANVAVPDARFARPMPPRAASGRAL